MWETTRLCKTETDFYSAQQPQMCHSIESPL